tara:strand:+ start:601 stop:798 length:198 start_codon:yes stop_codon:yes gene_type:complete
MAMKKKGKKAGGKVRMKVGGRAKPKGMRVGGRAKPKGMRVGGRAKPKGMKVGGRAKKMKKGGRAK